MFPSHDRYAIQVDGGNTELSISTTAITSNVSLGTTGGEPITSSGDITASGLLYASASNADGDYNHVVLYDTASGRFYYTGSYGGGGSSTAVAPEEVLTLSNITSNTVNFGTIATDATSSYVRAEFYARSGSVLQAARSVFVFSSSFSTITTTTTEDVRTHDSINLFNINTVSGSWDSSGNLVIKLRQYNGLNTDYKFRYIIM